MVMRDVTEARRREAVRETFIGVLSHELRTPVTTIFGGAKLLARERFDARRGDDAAASSATSTRRPSGSSGWSRTSSPSTASVRRPATSAGSRSCSSACCRASSSRRRRAGRASRSSSTSRPALPTVIADPTYVEQVVRNLLSNAAKYGGAGLDRHARRRGGRGRGARPGARRRPGLPRRRDEPAVRAVLSFARHRRVGERRRDRAVRVRPAGRPRWAGGSGPRRDRRAAPSSGSRCSSSMNESIR